MCYKRIFRKLIKWYLIVIIQSKKKSDKYTTTCIRQWYSQGFKLYSYNYDVISSVFFHAGSICFPLNRFHKDVDLSTLPMVGMSSVQVTQDINTSVYKCASCNYLFGNMSDLKRHLKTRHHVNVKDLGKVADNQGGLQVHLFSGIWLFCLLFVFNKTAFVYPAIKWQQVFSIAPVFSSGHPCLQGTMQVSNSV